MKKQIFSLTVLVIILLFISNSGSGQTSIPEVLYNGSLSEQMKYLDEKTRIYENYRAIREDMFQLIKKNSLDSLNKVKGQIILLAGMNRNLVEKTDSLSVTLEQTKAELREAVTTKNSIKVLGIEINKNVYNSIMWVIIAVLSFILATGFMALKRNIIATRERKNEIEKLMADFEAYRQKTRIEREKMSMDHFNEIKKLKGK